MVFDGSDPTAKPLAGDVFLREVQHPGRTWQLAGDAGAQLAAGGYHAQVTGSAEDGAALFHLDGTRSAIPKDNISALEKEVRARPAPSARTCCCGPSSKTRCSPRSVT